MGEGFEVVWERESPLLFEVFFGFGYQVYGQAYHADSKGSASARIVIPLSQSCSLQQRLKQNRQMLTETQTPLDNYLLKPNYVSICIHRKHIYLA